MNRYLIDTNILIYYFADEIPIDEIETLEQIFRISFNISIITKMEFLGWKSHTDEGYEKAKEFINFAHTIPLNNKITDMAIDIRRKTELSYPML